MNGKPTAIKHYKYNTTFTVQYTSYYVHLNKTYIRVDFSFKNCECFTSCETYSFRICICSMLFSILTCKKDAVCSKAILFHQGFKSINKKSFFGLLRVNWPLWNIIFEDVHWYISIIASFSISTIPFSFFFFDIIARDLSPNMYLRWVTWWVPHVEHNLLAFF